MKTIKDDRTDAERRSHPWLVKATDTVMSGWGRAAGGSSVAIWACRTKLEAETCAAWVRNRSEMRNVRIIHDRLPYTGTESSYLNSLHAAHVHVYVVRDGHPSIAEVAS